MSLERLNGLSSADLFVLFLIIVVWPIYSAVSLKRHPVEKIRHEPNLRISSYTVTILQLWGLTAAIGLVWIWLERPLSELGFRHQLDMPTMIAWGLAAAGILFSAVQLYQVMTSEKARESVKKQLADVGEHTALLMPRTQNEYRLSMLVAITAGITEEIIFRGYLIWAFALFVDPWIAGALSVCLFVFLHRYQSKAGLIQVAVFGAVTTIMVLISGSLWPAIVLHILVDMLNISLAWQVRNRSASSAQT
ncbi:MAG: CPBP family intramembrane metalloprotease [Acidimicrobiales bacterium]|nr:MAG: CPBP family intramembrane metalloprotease [Acidimicrobiales bacterium]